MSKIAFIFPGQGAQQLNMGLDAYKELDVVKQYLDRANEVLDFDLLQLLETDEDHLNQTAYTQPALVAVSVALLKGLQEQVDITPDYVAGLSLGEYSAHVASGSLSFEDSIKLVRQRGLLMEEAGSQSKGAMAAILKGDTDKIKEVCESTKGVVGVANYNSPVQVVISGEEDAVLKASDILKEEKMKVIPLKVSGAFHSPLMEPAATSFDSTLDQVAFGEMAIPVVANYTGKPYESQDVIKELLVEQLKGSVMWQQSVELMINDGVDTFVEIGPGKTLAGLLKKINRKVKVFNVDGYESLMKVSEELKTWTNK